MSKERKVKRVLVMLDYGPEDGSTGEVFDLTALATDMRVQSQFGNAHIELKVEARTSYEIDREAQPVKLTISWSGYAGEFCHGATHVEDVVNFVLPDNEIVKQMKKKADRLRKKTEDILRNAKSAKLEQVAAVRSQYPVARVTEMPMLPEIAEALPPA